MSERKAVRTIISGRVQGVCFRMETEQAALRFGVTGWVRNKRDGTVEALFEGEAGDVDAMVKWCKTGPPMASVAEVAVSEEPYTGKYRDFTIRYTA
ncbi:MAG: acylphosphatase [Dissulfuribacterales bacterium]